MIEIPEISEGKVLAAVETEVRECRFCALYETSSCAEVMACKSIERKDGKNVVFKLVDYPAQRTERCKN